MLSRKVYYYLGLDSWKNKWLDNENVFIKNDKQKTIIEKNQMNFQHINQY